MDHPEVFDLVNFVLPETFGVTAVRAEKAVLIKQDKILELGREPGLDGGKEGDFLLFRAEAIRAYDGFYFFPVAERDLIAGFRVFTGERKRAEDRGGFAIQLVK